MGGRLWTNSFPARLGNWWLVRYFSTMRYSCLLSVKSGMLYNFVLVPSLKFGWGCYKVLCMVNWVRANLYFHMMIDVWHITQGLFIHTQYRVTSRSIPTSGAKIGCPSSVLRVTESAQAVQAALFLLGLSIQAMLRHGLETNHKRTSFRKQTLSSASIVDHSATLLIACSSAHLPKFLLRSTRLHRSRFH